MTSLRLLTFIASVMMLEHGCAVDAGFGLTSTNQVFPVILSLSANDTRLNNRKRPYEICRLLKLRRQQGRLCRRESSVGNVLVQAVHRSIQECQYQFRDERWNCTLGQYRRNIVNKGYRETAFLHALSSASLMHSMSQACSTNQLEGCTCDTTGGKTREAWLWGGCGDNIKYGGKFTRRFLHERHANEDLKARIDQHNSYVGRRLVRSSMNTTCKCHGVSGSCTVRTCWKQLKPFQFIGDELRQRFIHARRVSASENGVATPVKTTSKTVPLTTSEAITARRRRKASRQSLVLLGKPAMTSKPVTKDTTSVLNQPRPSDLVYIEPSPMYCTRSSYSLGTKGRQCSRTNGGCNSLCCGRGYNVETRVVEKPCNCTFVWCCEAKCDVCTFVQDVYTCK